METQTNGPTRSEAVLPRPVAELPTPAMSTATRRLADKLADQFNLSDEGAMTIASGVVDPSTVRRAIETPERLHVPGGSLLAVRTDVWSRNLMPDPRNPRTSPSRSYPASLRVGRDEGTRFRPIAEPVSAADGRPELRVNLESQEQLAWALQRSTEFIKQQNDWSASISRQGVMTEVWVACTTYVHADGTPPATVLVTSEGSSRMTGVHENLGIRSADVPYTADERRLRSHIRGLNEKLISAGSPDQLDPDDAAMMRCEIVPALILLGFEPHDQANGDFGNAVKSLVAVRHVDPPEPWGEATENEALADAVLDELERRGLVTDGMAEWLAGNLSPAEATAAGFSDDPAIRSSWIVRMFTSQDPQVHQAVRVAVTSQSTRKRITTKLLFEIASSLILRSVPEDNPRTREGLRRWLKDAFHPEVAGNWVPNFMPHDELAAEALAEVQAGEPGSAARQLMARATYPLIVNGSLYGDLGAAGRDRQPDRRKPSEVIDRMRTSEHGIRQLNQVLADSAAKRRARAVDMNGSVKKVGDKEVSLTDFEIRQTFAPAGSPTPKPAAQTPAELLHNALADLGNTIHSLESAIQRVEAVQAEDGTPVIDTLGAEPSHCQTWTEILFRIVTRKLPVWEERHAVRHAHDFEDAFDLDDPDEKHHDLDDELVHILSTDNTDDEA